MEIWKKALKQLLQVNPKPNITSPKIPKPNQPPPKPITLSTTINESSQIPINPKPDIQPQNKAVSPAKSQDCEKEFLKVFRQLTYRHRAWDIWKDFITMTACALSNPADKLHYDEREALYMKIIRKYSKQEGLLFPELIAETVMALEVNPEQDFLGKIFMDLNLGNEDGGQFFTPYHVCQFMAEIALGDVVSKVEKDGYITIHDPCCGAGAILIAGVNTVRKQLEKVNLNFQNHVLVSAQDIDYTTALMCYIQLSLLGVAGYVKIGNSLTDPMSSADTTENYWFTIMYFSDVWSTRRFIKNIGSLFKEKEKESDV